MESSNNMSVIYFFVKLKVLSYVVRFEISLYILIYGLNKSESVNPDMPKGNNINASKLNSENMFYISHLDFNKLWSVFSTIKSQNNCDDFFKNKMKKHIILAE